MNVRIEVPGESDSHELLALFGWLTRDPDTRRHVPISLEDEGRGEDMGAADFINAVVTEATNMAALAVAIATWRDSRAPAPSVKLVVNAGTVIITSESAESIQQTLQSLCANGESAGATGDSQ
jgi:hypothetical protein